MLEWLYSKRPEDPGLCSKKRSREHIIHQGYQEGTSQGHLYHYEISKFRSGLRCLLASDEERRDDHRISEVEDFTTRSPGHNNCNKWHCQKISEGLTYGEL